MQQRIVCLCLLVQLGCWQAAPLAAAELPERLQAGKHRLVLNGAGARTKTLLQLYTAGLYLTEPESNPAAILAADEAMAIRIQITSGFVSQDNLLASLIEGFEKSTGGQLAPLQAQIAEFRQCFQEPITKGDTIDLVYAPEHGVIVNRNGKLKGVVRGVEFKRALFGIWLSDAPADTKLKQALLNGQVTR